jgi:hypothetical protein
MKRRGLAAIAFLATGLYGQTAAPPTVSSISPSSVIAGSPTFTLTVTGTGFQRVAADSGYSSTSQVRWGGVALATGYLSATERVATIDASLVASAGTATVDVVNPGPVLSNAVEFTILAGLGITTDSPLPPATVGSFYSVSLAASGGTPPYRNWRVVEGALPGGLTLSVNGALSGTPTSAGTSMAQISVDDSGNQSATGIFYLTVNVPPMTIATNSPLPGATAGTPYSQTFTATGGVSPYTWSSTGALPTGLTLSAAGGLSGTPTQGGTFNFTVRVADSSGSFTTKAFSLTVTAAALAIATNPSLPSGTTGLAYSQELAATGGIPPYTWSVPTGALQTGLTLSSAGLLSGTPTQGGTSNFTVSVADASGSIATRAFTLTVGVPQTTVSTTGLSDFVGPAEQPSFDVQLSAAYPLTITGTVTLTFTPDAVYSSDDPAIQFSTGGRTMDFTIPAGQISAFPTALPSIQTGTVAGRINLALNYFAGGQNITPANQLARVITIARSAPKITSVELEEVDGGFKVLVTGYSPPRRVIQADFAFTPAAGRGLKTTYVTVIVDTDFATWYSGTASPEYGSIFLYTQPFEVHGNLSDIGSVSVTLAHATGTSTAVSASF